MTGRRHRTTARIVALLVSWFLLAPLVFGSSSAAAAERWDCSGGTCQRVPATGAAPPYQPPDLRQTAAPPVGQLPSGLLPGVPGGSCPGGNCVPGALQPGIEPLQGRPGFLPGQGFSQQPFELLQQLFRNPAFLAATLMRSITARITRQLFTRPASPQPDIIPIDPSDPRGINLLGPRRVSPGARRGVPPTPPPTPDFRVERREQRRLVEESPAPPQTIRPRAVEESGAPCIGGACPSRR